MSDTYFLPMESAPKDHTWVRLLIDYSGEGAIDFPLFDSDKPSWTLGYCGDDHTGEKEGWIFVGWDWDQDEIVETRQGKPIGWLPFTPEDQLPPTLSAAMRDVFLERRRHIEVEGFTPEHDDQHRGRGMARAAACYALFASVSDEAREATDLPARMTTTGKPISGWTAFLELWPWARSWWKPKDRRRDLVRAGALIIAEIERLDRAAEREANHA